MIVTLSILIALVLFPQITYSQSASDLFSEFVETLPEAEYPFYADIPMEDFDEAFLLQDNSLLIKYVYPHKMGLNAEIYFLKKLIDTNNYTALLAGLVLREERATYLLTYTKEGRALSKLRIGGYSDREHVRYEQWASITESNKVLLSSMTRFTENGEEIACTQTESTHTIFDDGNIEYPVEEITTDCAN